MANAAEMVSIALEGKDNISPAAKSGVASLDGLDTAAKKADTSFVSMTGSVTKYAAAAGAIVVTGVVAGFAAATGAAMEFESKISAIGAVTGSSQSEMDSLSKAALQLGKDTSFSASEAAVGMEELAKAGVSVGDILGGAGRASLDLAAAGAISVGDAAEIASNAMNVFGLKGADMAHVADVIAGAANSSAIGVNDYKFSLSAAGAVAATVGMSFEDLSTAIAVMGQNGLKGSDAGTSLKTMLMNLQPRTLDNFKAFNDMNLLTTDLTKGMEYLRSRGIEPMDESYQSIGEALAEQVMGIKDWTKMSSAQEKKFFELAESIGLFSNKMFDANGSVVEGAEMARLLAEGTADMTDAERLMALEMAFGTDAVRAAAIMAKTGAEGFNSMATSMANVSARQVAEERLNNLAGSIEKLKGSLETGAIILGGLFTGALKGMADSATETLNDIIGILEILPDSFAGIVQAFQNGGTIGSEAMAGFTAVFGEFGDEVASALGMAGEAFRGFMEVATAIGTFLAEHTEVVYGFGAAILSLVAISATVSAIGAMVAAIGLLVSPLGLVVAAIGLLTAAWMGNWGDIQGKTAVAIEYITGLIQTGMAEWESFWTAHGDQITTIASAAWEYTVAGATTAFALIKGVFTAGMQAIHGDWEGAWNTITETAATIWEGWKTQLGAVLTIIGALFGPTWNQITAETTEFLTDITTEIDAQMAAGQAAIDAALAAVVGVFTGAWTQVTTATTTFLTAIQTEFTTQLAAVIGVFTGAWTQVTTATTTFLTAIQTEFTTQLAAGQAIIDTALAAITGVFTAGWAAIQAVQTAAWNMLTPENQARITEIQQLFTELWTIAGQLWTAGTAAVTATVTAWWTAIAAEATTQYTALTTAAQTGWDAISAVWTTVTTAVTTAVTAWWTQETTKATATYTILAEAAQTGWDAISKIWTTVTTAITAAVTTWWTQETTKATATYTILAEAAQTGWDAISKIWTTVTGQVTTTVTEWWTKLTTQASEMMTAIGAKIQELLSPWVEWFNTKFTEIGQAFTGAASSLGNSAAELGTAIMTALADAITAKVNAVVEVVAGAVKSALEKAKGILGSFQWGQGGSGQGSDDYNSYVRQAAKRLGIDPDQAAAVMGKEGGSGGWYSEGHFDTGDSYGPLQLHYAGGSNPKEGMGDRFTRATGIDLRTDKSLSAQKKAVDYALSQAAEKGDWSEWYGADSALGSRYTAVKRVTASTGYDSEGIQMMNQTQQQWAKNSADAKSICGPYLAALFTDAVGRPPTADEARQIAYSYGYGGTAGMLVNDQVDDMANAMIAQYAPTSGMRATETKVTNTAQASQMMQQALANGSAIVGVNTQGHYYGADAYDPATGMFHVGGTGLSAGGSEWMTVEQMTALMGPLNGIITLTGQGGEGFLGMGADSQTMASTGQTANESLLLSTTTLSNGATVAISQMGNDITTTIRDASGNVTGQWTSTVEGLVTGATSAQTGVNSAVDIMTANSLVAIDNMGTGIMTSVSDMAGTNISTITDMSGNVTGLFGTLSDGTSVSMADMGTNVTTSVDAMTGNITTTMTTASGDIITTTTDMAGNLLDQWVTLGTDVTANQDATAAELLGTETQSAEDIRDINLKKNEELLKNQHDTGRGLIESVTTDTGVIVERWMLAGGDIETVVKDSNGAVLENFVTSNADIMADTDRTHTKLIGTTTDALGQVVEIYRESTGEVVQLVTDSTGKVVEEYETTAQSAEDTLKVVEEFYGGLEEVPEVDLSNVVEEYEKAQEAAEDYRREAERAPDPDRNESGRDRTRGGRQYGGRLNAGDLAWVGEGGHRELFMSDRAGQIIAENDINYGAIAGYDGSGDTSDRGSKVMVLKQEMYVQSTAADMQRYTERAMRKLASEWSTE